MQIHTLLDEIQFTVDDDVVLGALGVDLGRGLAVQRERVGVGASLVLDAAEALKNDINPRRLCNGNDCLTLLLPDARAVPLVLQL